ncbi:MAG TPA: asparagine synthase (glutamine-hydrolyzing) [Anaerolineae bacterium]|nr:asparagine synthase (glutamine-hydrolyzing) [Anaerolineae bacterium]HOR00356.1 asparagine synthase (glutamine-hydrolyzing) [Anaerolineae bacterium]HPL28228.1 asparagine synthase (glutamine-hydrolyzing) [Anaerolineae bacterium]
MCGIYGLVGAGLTPGQIEAMLADLAANMAQRGSGARQRVCLAGAGLGAGALAGIAPHGRRQPVHSEDETLWAVIDGALYNGRQLRRELAGRHRLAQDGDAAAVVHLYKDLGPEFPRALHGAFALALWDARLGRLVVARDRLGEKPLYLWRGDGVLAFASELRALTSLPAAPGEIDPLSLAGYIACGYVPGPASMVRGIDKLPPATVEVIDLRLHGRQQRYWQLPLPVPARTGDEAASAENIARPLRRACIHAYDTADGPAGVLLSGGLDSSLIAALLAQAERGPVQAFALGYDGDEHSLDLAYARRVAAALGLRLHSLTATPRELAEAVPYLAQHLDEPCADPTALSLALLAQFAARDVRVVLTGAGADELFAGYALHRAACDALRAHPPVGPGGNPLFPFMTGLPWPLAEQLFQPALLAGLDRSRPPGWFDAGPGPQPAGDPLWQVLAADLTGRLPEQLLAVGHRLTVAASIQARSPYLNVDVVEAAMRCPSTHKLGPRGDKLVLRRMARGVLPQEVTERPKQGFPSPLLGPWFAAVVSPLWESLRAALPAQFASLFRMGTVDWVAHQAQAGDAGLRGLLWKLVVLAAWLQARAEV